MPNKKFHLFHLSLIPANGPLFEEKSPNREKYLRSLLEKNLEFSIGKSINRSKIYWVYKGSVGEAILGILQKQVPHQRHLSPDKGGEEVIDAEWQGAWVVIDPTHHDKGQRVSVEVDNIVGAPNALLNALLGYLNKNKDRDYDIIHKPIFNENNFWNYAKSANNKLTRVQFDFVVPNMFGTKKQIDKDLQEAGLEAGAQNVSIIYQSKKGINALSGQVKNAVEYIQKGAGRITARAHGFGKFDSDANPSTTEMPKFDANENQATEEFNKHKDKVLGYDGENTDNSDSDNTA